VTFRLDRIPVAIADLRQSPLIGLGANSFGQRHTDISQNAPDHLAILALAALYESGVLGAAGLGIGFALVLWAFFRATRRRSDRGMIAAYAGALASLLVAYEATNALNFALIWLIAGAGLAAASEPQDAVEGLTAPLRG
jgi:O-antigen ligase